jgi:hypothetical protein
MPTRALGLIALLVMAASTVALRFSDEDCIRAGRRTSVHVLDRKLADSRFDLWFRKVVGKGAKISWECNDCGESGSGLDSGRIFPGCAQALAQLEDGRTVYVWIDVGDENAGIYRRPELFWAGIEGGKSNPSFDSLSQLARYLRNTDARR